MIDGVRITSKKKIRDERGAVMHMLRADDPEFQKFGEIYFSQVRPQVVKGWHLHKSMTLNYLVVVGAIRLALFDDRENSSTRGSYQTLILSSNDVDSQLVTIPPMIWNGFQGLGETASIVANCASLPHDPLEIVRRDYRDFNYDWSSKVDGF